MKTEVKEIYKCDHCNKLYQRKNACIDHEKVCVRNPKNDRACFSCNHMVKKEMTHVVDTYIGEQEEDVSVCYCPKLKKALYPPKVEHKGNAFECLSHADYGEVPNEPMPVECDKRDGQESDFLGF